MLFSLKPISGYKNGSLMGHETQHCTATDMNQQSQERILISVIHGDYHLGERNAIASAKDISQREQEMQRFCDYGPREIFAPRISKR
ncbi:hypothetical protein CEXT_572381 [Caerostris extrusa]|uniref:Uncharacterized protein n=1 Tax=Caerostris extrusa TaxID=172846 RepID=A0AAV4MQ04_CAEEX|nr:hypothetical protein CEXT_572381 [Caerostris extrusa]